MEEKKAKILLCEDDQNLGMVLKNYLNWTIMMLYWNAMAVWDCRISTRKFELCLLDVMPNMDGFTLAEEIRDVDPDIPFFPER